MSKWMPMHWIRVNIIHDTLCFHEAITHIGNHKNLNDTLIYNGIGPNDIRDGSVYKWNPRFWASRPLTSKMIAWASSDVDKLFDLADKQLARISPSAQNGAFAMSQENASLVVNMQVRSGSRVRNPGLFIGRRGANIRSIERELGVLCYQKSDGWFVYFKSEASLKRLLHLMDM